MAAETTPLLPCPNTTCNSTNTIGVDEVQGFYFGHCERCGSNGPIAGTRAMAIEEWNRRDTTALDELRAAVVAYFEAEEAWIKAGSDYHRGDIDTTTFNGICKTQDTTERRLRALVGLEG